MPFGTLLENVIREAMSSISAEQGSFERTMERSECILDWTIGVLWLD